MKIVIKAGILLLLIWVFAFIGYQAYGTWWNPPAIKKKTEAFLECIQSQKFDEAVTLFGGSIGYDNWVSDMRKLHDGQGFQLAAYQNVRAEYDDGSFSTGHADLIFEIDGKSITTQAILTFGPGGMPKQVCAITPPGIKQGAIPELEEWNKLVCGGSF
ncbi:hypothetical protein RB620_14175 [Paenibacillus sp. LHD-117]|uniref:hypothetical protein n=1 Tax=Paenibacillus sp. LHD-117 TaxID=3071412 RepID=UPI0027E02D3B|nr:hypothetical protein [Paenibacillus sp. LHD-117]MDQ6420573.1 hypothetical protein [Paenibacillus sp. LHD-117]